MMRYYIIYISDLIRHWGSVRFAVEAAGRHYGGHLGIVAGAEAEAKAGSEELAGKLRLSAETVDNPWHRRAHRAA